MGAMDPDATRTATPERRPDGAAPSGVPGLGSGAMAATPGSEIDRAASTATPAPPLDATADLVAALRARGMRVTPQRVVLHRALRELHRHVTADELLDAVAERLPNVSPPTIYATLDLFEELGIVRRVQRAGTTLFDPRTEPHHHLVCAVCGSIEDLDSELDTAALERAAATHGFAHERIEAVVHGRCARCRAA